MRSNFFLGDLSGGTQYLPSTATADDYGDVKRDDGNQGYGPLAYKVVGQGGLPGSEVLNQLISFRSLDETVKSLSVLLLFLCIVPIPYGAGHNLGIQQLGPANQPIVVQNVTTISNSSPTSGTADAGSSGWIAIESVVHFDALTIKSSGYSRYCDTCFSIQQNFRPMPNPNSAGGVPVIQNLVVVRADATGSLSTAWGFQMVIGSSV